MPYVKNAIGRKRNLLQTKTGADGGWAGNTGAGQQWGGGGGGSSVGVSSISLQEPPFTP